MKWKHVLKWLNIAFWSLFASVGLTNAILSAVDKTAKLPSINLLYHLIIFIFVTVYVTELIIKPKVNLPLNVQPPTQDESK